MHCGNHSKVVVGSAKLNVCGDERFFDLSLLDLYLNTGLNSRLSLTFLPSPSLHLSLQRRINYHFFRKYVKFASTEGAFTRANFSP